ncbi:hypothetical protein PHMEG_00026497 [Phytophthora megakarya]|uniref:Uncharacterized protein n=1 Tax=Phytophthora megakarya TaxID=4795 RepID=A0A225VC10_9STRA|nr:hypothetical protein PHMEG_00026497 [Phytophthora megakarya]
MTGPRHAQKMAGRGDGGREDESLRRSRRKQGLPPLEYKDLVVVVRESRATRAAQDAERAMAQEQPVSEPVAGDDQALSSVAIEEVTPKPGQDVDVELLEEKAPPVVKAEPEVQDLTADDSVPESESKKIVRRTVVRVKSEPTSVPGAAELGLAAQATSGPAAPESSQADALAKAYVAHQVHRWEQVPSGRVFTHKWRMKPGFLSYAQNAVVSDTLFFEAGFQFNNAVLEWFRTHAVNVGLDQIRFVTETIQCLFAVEFIEWKKLTMGVFCEVTPGPELQSTALKPEAQGNSPMTDAEASLLGTEFTSRFRVTGVRTGRSFVASSSDGEPEVKRPHNAPSTPMSSVSMRS